MKKNIVLSLALLVLLSFVYYFEEYRPRLNILSKQNSESLYPFVSLSACKTVKLPKTEIFFNNSNSLVSSKEGIYDEADPLKITEFFKKLKMIKTQKKINLSQSDMSLSKHYFPLKNKIILKCILDNNDQITYEFGNKTQLSSSFYLSIKKKNSYKILVVDDERAFEGYYKKKDLFSDKKRKRLMKIVNEKSSYFLNKNFNHVFSFSDFKIKSLEFDHGSELLNFDVFNDGHYLKPKRWSDLRVDKKLIKKYFNQIKSLTLIEGSPYRGKIKNLSLKLKFNLKLLGKIKDIEKKFGIYKLDKNKFILKDANTNFYYKVSEDFYAFFNRLDSDFLVKKEVFSGVIKDVNENTLSFDFGGKSKISITYNLIKKIKQMSRKVADYRIKEVLLNEGDVSSKVDWSKLLVLMDLVNGQNEFKKFDRVSRFNMKNKKYLTSKKNITGFVNNEKFNLIIKDHEIIILDNKRKLNFHYYKDSQKLKSLYGNLKNILKVKL
jgi:hypothetical protein